MKNRVAIITTAIALVALMIVGATLAWFTDTDKVTNAVSLGELGIKVYEYVGEFNEEGEPVIYGDGNEYTVVPGDEHVKAPFVTNTGSVDTYLRVKILFNTDFNFDALEADAKAQALANWEDFQASVLAQVSEDEGWYSDAGRNAFAAKLGIIDTVPGLDNIFYYNTKADKDDPDLGKLAAGATTGLLFKTISFPGEKWGNEMANFSFTIDVVADAIQFDNISLEDLFGIWGNDAWRTDI